MNKDTAINVATKTKKPIIAGLLSVVGGTVALTIAIGMLFGEGYPFIALLWFSPFLVIFGIAPIVGGIYAIQRKRWLLSLICSGCGILMFYVAIPALALIILSKEEFT